jgi:hypothetical protein
MRALSVRPPWAAMIANGSKTLEVRTWRTSYRGMLLICQSRGGGPVALVNLVDCRVGQSTDVMYTGGVSAVGSFVWQLQLVRRVVGAPIKGRLGFYDVPDKCFAACND